MRKHALHALALTGLIGMAPLGAADGPAGNDLSIDQVPAPVKATVQREAAGQEVRWLQRSEVDGRTIYTARIQQQGLDTRLMIGEDGALLGSPDWGGTSFGSDETTHAADRLTLSELPAAARATIEREAMGHEIRWIERDLDQGRAVYHARVKQEGLDKRITVDQDGGLVSKTDWKDELGVHRDHPVGEVDRELDKDITLDQAPLPVQQTLTREAGGEPIRWVQRDIDDGKMVYRARIRQEGLDKRVTVSPDGTVLDKKDFAETNAKTKDAWEKTKEGSKKAWEATKEGTSKAWDQASDAVQGDHLTLQDLPAAVQATIQREAGGHEIRDIDHELVDGKHLYDVKLHVKDANDIHLKVAEDGALIEKKQ